MRFILRKGFNLGEFARFNVDNACIRHCFNKQDGGFFSVPKGPVQCYSTLCGAVFTHEIIDYYVWDKKRLANS